MVHRGVLHRAALAALLVVAGCSENSATEEQPAVPDTSQFPEDFLWGTASAAYQSEGTNDPAQGTVLSNWQEWEELGKIADGQKNPDGCGFYDRFDDDFALAEQLGNRAVRFGVEWARIEPTPGNFDQQAIDHYRAVAKAARAHGLEPIVTLYHWVVPTWVQSPKAQLDLLAQPPSFEKVGAATHLKSGFADAMRPFVAKMGEQLGDLVDTWVVLNEPYTVLFSSYLTGTHPGDGKLLNLLGLRNAALNYIITYPAAYDALVESDTVDANGDGQATQIGNAVVGAAGLPLDPKSDADIAAARRMQYLVDTWMMDAWSAGKLDVNVDGDTDDQDGVLPEGVYAEQLGNRLDYVGVNYYSTLRVSACPGLIGLVTDPEAKQLAENIAALPQAGAAPGQPMSENGLEVNAPGLLDTLRVFEPYTHREGAEPRPMLVMENGHGDCDDDQRAKYIAEHLQQLALAVQEGIPVRGYMLWSLTDNFEWGDGRNQCFGIYRVSYDAGFARKATRSVALYQKVIAARAITPELLEEYASGRYPTDCTYLADPTERQACIDALPPSPVSGLASLIDGICGK